MRALLLVAVAAAAVALPGAATPASGPDGKTTGTRGAVDSISADGARVAIRSTLSGSKRTCNYVAVWAHREDKNDET